MRLPWRHYVFVVGFFFLLFGQYKVFGSVFIWHGGFEQWIRSFIMQGAYPWMKSIIEEIILPHVRICAFLTAYGELMIGLGLVAGVLTRVASVFGIALMSLLWFSAGIRDHTLPFGDTSVRPSTGQSSLRVSLLFSSANPKLDGLLRLGL